MLGVLPVVMGAIPGSRARIASFLVFTMLSPIFLETIVGKLTEVYQTVHLKEFTDFPKKDEKGPTEVFTDIHFEKKSVAHEAYHSSHGFY